MSRLALAASLALACLATTAQAGGVAEPQMEAEVIVQETASSGGDNWVGIAMTLLLLGTAVAN
jgi:hypothetical protein